MSTTDFFSLLRFLTLLIEIMFLCFICKSICRQVILNQLFYSYTFKIFKRSATKTNFNFLNFYLFLVDFLEQEEGRGIEK